MEEVKKETATEKKLSALQEAKDLNATLEKGMAELKAALAEAKEMTAERILSGTPDAGEPVKKEPISEEAYAAAAKEGKILE